MFVNIFQFILFYFIFFILAITNLGVCFRNGTGCDKNEKKAMELYQKAADMGDASGKLQYSFYNIRNIPYFLKLCIILE